MTPYHVQETLNLLSNSTANANGASQNFKAGKVALQARYAVTGNASSTNCDVVIQTSLDNANWANVATVANVGAATSTGTITGPIPYARATLVGTSIGTINAKVTGILLY